MSNFSTPPSRRGLLKSSPDSNTATVLLRKKFNATNVVVERLDLRAFYPGRESSPYALVLHNILSKEECEALIAKSESQEFEMARINTGHQEVSMPEIRNNDRTYIDDDDLAEEIWKRIAASLPKESEPQLHTFKGFMPEVWNAVGINERLRVLRYGPGTYFAPHFDGSYQRREISHPQYGDTSFITAQIYLNEGFTGGATSFINPNSHDESSAARVDVIPKTGSILIFEHRLFHEGAMLIEGCKYTIRTDIMFHKS